MNERIRELAEQAQDWADAHAPYASEEHEYFAEKFTELIVKECLEICYEAEHDGERIAYAAEQIAERFGVEQFGQK